MMRLALAATMIATAYSATSGTMVSIYMWDGESDVAADQALCQDAGLNTTPAEGDQVSAGTTNTLGTVATHVDYGYITAGGPKWDAGGIGITTSAPFIVDHCYDLGGSGSVAEALPILGSMAGGHANAIIVTDSAEVFKSIKFKGANGTLALTMEVYTDQACATLGTKSSGVLTPETGGCDNSGTCTNCVTEATCIADSVWTYGWACTECDPADLAEVNAIASGYENVNGGGSADMTKNAGWTTNYITAAAYTWSTTLACSTVLANQTAANAGMGSALWPICNNEYNCDRATARDTNVDTAFVANEAYMWQNAACFIAGSTTSWQVRCDPTDGTITHTVFTGDECDFADKTANAAASGSTLFTKNTKCAAVANSSTASWAITNTDAEWETVCPTIGVSGGTTGVKSLKVYSTTTTLARATDTVVADMTGAGVTGSRDILLGVCYTAGSDGTLSGFIGGPFGAGGATTEPAANKGSWMFAEDATVATEVEALWYTEKDCSGTATSLDDGNDASTGWPHIGFAVFNSAGAQVTGTASAAGTTVAQLTAATKFITVKKHTDANASTTAVHGAAGVCSGLAHLGEVSADQGLILDHFILGNCHIKTGSATAASQVSYKWWCDTSDASIKYAEYVGEACAGSAVANTDLIFTKTGKCICQNCTGSAVTNDVSWEIRNDDTQWDAMCSTASSDDSDDSESSAGKVAATVAAAAAAALLI